MREVKSSFIDGAITTSAIAISERKGTMKLLLWNWLISAFAHICTLGVVFQALPSFRTTQQNAGNLEKALIYKNQWSAEALNAVLKLPEWKHFENALALDPDGSTHLNRYLSAGGLGGPFRPVDIAQRFLNFLLSADGRAVTPPNPQRYETAFDEFSAFLRAESFTQVDTVFIDDISFGDQDATLNLSNGAHLSMANRHELLDFVQSHLFTDDELIHRVGRSSSGGAALTVRTQVPLVIVGPDTEVASSTNSATIVECERALVRALLLSGATRTNVLGRHSTIVEDFGMFSSSFHRERAITNGQASHIELTIRTASLLQRYFSLFIDKTKPTAALELAMRRFELASSRTDDIDQLIDLVIATEALFLGDANDELTFRFAIRAA